MKYIQICPNILFVMVCGGVCREHCTSEREKDGEGKREQEKQSKRGRFLWKSWFSQKKEPSHRKEYEERIYQLAEHIRYFHCLFYYIVLLVLVNT